MGASSFPTDSVLPFPRHRLPWMVTGVIIIFLMVAYYNLFYSQLETSYFGNFWINHPVEELEYIDLTLYVPRHVSNLSEREMLISITNTYSEPVNVVLATSAAVDEEHAEDSVVLIREGSTVEPNTYVGSSDITFNSIPPGAIQTRQMWIKTLGQIEGDIELLVSIGITRARDGSPLFWGADGVDESNSSDLENYVPRLDEISFDNTTIIETAAGRTISQSLLRLILLPPWSNGLIPLLVIVSVYLFNLGEFRKKCESFWVIIILAILILLTDLAVMYLFVLIATKDWSFANIAWFLGPTAVIAAAIAAAYLLWTRCGRPDGGPNEPNGGLNGPNGNGDKRRLERGDNDNPTNGADVQGERQENAGRDQEAESVEQANVFIDPTTYPSGPGETPAEGLSDESMEPAEPGDRKPEERVEDTPEIMGDADPEEIFGMDPKLLDSLPMDGTDDETTGGET